MEQPTEARIAALEAELAALRAEMQEFTHTVSHDLRAPLRHIVSFAQLVQEDAGHLLNPEVQGFLDTIGSSARHMGLLLDGLTALSRLGGLPLDLYPVPLQSVVDEVCTELRIQQAPRSLDWHVADDLPVVHADPNLLRQALRHVLGNAVKFTVGTEPARIDIGTVASPDPHTVVLQIRDNGAGFNPALQSQLLRVFGRLHSAQQFEGIGMGLVLTRKIMQRLGGAVGIDATLDGGCCVRLTLPLG